MYIEHVAVWTKNLEQLKTFYETYFQASAGKKYLNPNRQFESCFLTFTSGARLELMYRPTIPPSLDDVEKQFTGYIHLAIAVGSEAKVNDLTARLRLESQLSRSLAGGPDK